MKHDVKVARRQTCPAKYYAAQFRINEINRLNACLRPPETAAFITRGTIKHDCR